MKAEERALALLVEISRVGKITMVGGPVEAKVAGLIAAAIRDAENDAYERAIAECQRVEAEANGNSAEQAGAFHGALAITALKHKDI